MNTTLNARKLLSLTSEQREALATTKTHAIELALFEQFVKEFPVLLSEPCDNSTPLPIDAGMAMFLLQDMMDAASKASNERYVIEEKRRVQNGLYNIALTEGWLAAQAAAQKSLVSVQEVLACRHETKHLIQQ